MYTYIYNLHIKNILFSKCSVCNNDISYIKKLLLIFVSILTSLGTQSIVHKIELFFIDF